jgi:biopolymer transport protein ExbB
MKGLRSAVALILLAAPVVSQAWWNGDWNFRKEISFDLSPTGADIAGTPTDVPVLIRLHIGNFAYFADTKPDGSDLRFIAADDKTPLKFHIERYDPQTQMAFLWVSVPRLTGGGNTNKIFLYYGNSKAPAAADPAGTYDKAQAVVYHFSEAAGAAPQDATANKNQASAAGGELYPTALIGGGIRFNGSAALRTPMAPSLRVLPQQGATLSAWVRFDTAPQNAYVAALEDEGRELILGINGTQAFAQLTGPSGSATLPQTNGQLTAGAWHHLAVRAGDGGLMLFVDGVDAGGKKDIEVPEIAGSLTLGGSAHDGHFFSGEMDEFQFATTARSADWIKAAARSQGMEAKLVAYGGDAQKDSGGVSYFAITLKNVTVDGWVVISILIAMFAGSMIVMIGKGFYLAGVRKANEEFLSEFHELRADLTALEGPGNGQTNDRENGQKNGQKNGDKDADAASSEGDPRFGASTIYPLYHHGMRELGKRLEGQAAGAQRAKTLSAQSIEAIRATMDATLTRLTQRLSSQMVLLTICISGGPFLGLLGTVIGVMITFAAIAASGDVNINAIAPGTAAALAATVAGLAVAIPCLFGYNYLNTRIKEISADMRVFLDEFVTQIAEHYS